jgi:putative Holliday junction resolvase
MKVLAIDYGSKRIGLAIGDAETKLALPYGTWEEKNDAEIMARLKQLINEEEIDVIVVGEPITMAGGESAQTRASRVFAGRLKDALKLEVVLMDERLTSRQAEAVGFGTDAPLRSRDELAAMFLLQDYLERESNHH